MPKFDISYVHMRYNKTAVSEVMNDEVKKISILRDPSENFISSWRYYSKLTEKLRKMLPVRVETIIMYLLIRILTAIGLNRFLVLIKVRFTNTKTSQLPRWKTKILCLRWISFLKIHFSILMLKTSNFLTLNIYSFTIHRFFENLFKIFRVEMKI